MVSSGPFSGLSEGRDCWDLEDTQVRGGFMGHGTVPTEEGDVWERVEWLLRGGLTWGTDWLGLRLEEEVPMVKVVRPLCGVD